MTAHKIVILECDECGATALPETMIVLDLIHMVGPPAHAGEARQGAHAKGWTHSVTGKDLCKNCGPVRPTVGKLLGHLPHPHWGHER
jgi:hypothetical protein